MATMTTHRTVVEGDDGRYRVRLEKSGKEVPADGYETKAEAEKLLATLEAHRGELLESLGEWDPPMCGPDGRALKGARLPVELERRALAATVELRQAPGGSTSPGMMKGYAAVFGRLSEDLGGFYEEVAPGAFDRAIRDTDVLCLRNHEPEALLGRMSAGTLRLSTDTKGLMFECELPNTTTGRDTAEMIRRGDMKGCSFSFGVRAEEWNWHTGAQPIRTLRDVDMADVGPVTTPAYRDTSVALRSLERNRPALVKPLSLLRAKLRLAEAF
jgi:HK97 family phage prohead protease